MDVYSIISVSFRMIELDAMYLAKRASFVNGSGRTAVRSPLKRRTRRMVDPAGFEPATSTV